MVSYFIDDLLLLFPRAISNGGATTPTDFERPLAGSRGATTTPPPDFRRPPGGELERGLELGTGVFLPHTKVKQLRFIQDARALVKKATHYLRRYWPPGPRSPGAPVPKPFGISHWIRSASVSGQSPFFKLKYVWFGVFVYPSPFLPFPQRLLARNRCLKYWSFIDSIQ